VFTGPRRKVMRTPPGENGLPEAPSCDNGIRQHLNREPVEAIAATMERPSGQRPPRTSVIARWILAINRMRFYRICHQVDQTDFKRS
jgi:hypothetical protein